MAEDPISVHQRLSIPEDQPTTEEETLTQPVPTSMQASGLRRAPTRWSDIWERLVRLALVRWRCGLEQ